jgi:hypothetical protein
MDSCHFGCMIYRACPVLLLCNMSIKSVDGWSLGYFAGDLDGLTLMNSWLMLNGLSIWFSYMPVHDCLVFASLSGLSRFTRLNSIRCYTSNPDTWLFLKCYFSCYLNGNAKDDSTQSSTGIICVNCLFSKTEVVNNSRFRELAYPSIWDHWDEDLIYKNCTHG